MSNHHKKQPRERATGPVDKNRESPDVRMDREEHDTDATSIPNHDLRGKGRQAIGQQERERDFDAIDRDRSTNRKGG